MKRIHRSCVAVLLLLAMLLSCVPAIAAGGSRGFTTQQKAEALKSLGIFRGPTRASSWRARSPANRRSR